MQIQRDYFTTLLKKITPVPNYMNEVLLDFKDDGVHIENGETRTRALFLKAFVPLESFEEYEAIGLVGMRNIQTIIKTVETLDSETIILEKLLNKLTISSEDGKKKIECSLPDPSYIDTVNMNLDLAVDDQFEVADIDKLMNIKKNFDSVKANNFAVNIKGDKVTFVTKSPNDEFSIEETMDLGKECIETSFLLGRNLINVLTNLKTAFTFGYKKDAFVTLTCDEAGTQITYVLAAVVVKK